MDKTVFVVQPDLPLSSIQTGILADQWLAPATTRYNVPVCMRFDGALELGALRLALQSMVDRHEILRTVYRNEAGGIFQAIAPNIAVPFELLDVSSPAELTECLARLAAHPFDLSKEPPVRASIVKEGEGRGVFLLLFHHIAVDGWSVRLLLKEISEDYNALRRAGSSSISGPELQYADWAAFEQQELESQRSANLAAQVVRRLERVAHDLDLPLRPPTPPPRGNENGAEMLTFSIPDDVLERAQALARSEGASLYAVFAAAYALLMSRLGDRASLAIGAPVALRDDAVTHQTVGCFINTAIICIPVQDETDKKRYIGITREAIIDALDERRVPLREVAAALQAKMPAAEFKLRCFFNFDDAELAQPLLDGLEISFLNLDRGTAKFDFTLSMIRLPGSVRAAFDIASGILAPEILRSLPSRFLAALEWLCRPDEETLASYSLLTDGEKKELLALGRGPSVSTPSIPLDQAILGVAQSIPGSIAVSAPDGSLSFAELSTRARAISASLSAAGIGRGDRVLIQLPRGTNLILSMLGVLHAGAAYVPLDVGFPHRRILDIAEDAEATGIICAEGDATLLAELLPPKVAVAYPTSSALQILRKSREPVMRCPAAAGDMAYMIYTSGSTGKPKGVMVPHQGIVNYLHWANAAYKVDQGRGSPVVTSSAFDATLLSFWSPLLCGKPVVLLPEAGAIEALAEHLSTASRYSFVKMTPAHLDLLSELKPVSDQSAGAHLFVVGGEALRSASVLPWLDQAPKLRIINEYGPTETVVGCAIHEASNDDLVKPSIPIGKAIDNTFLYVLDSRLQHKAKGLVGELFIGGNSVAWGYWNKARLTAERFIADPFSSAPGARMYRTGDLVRFDENGILEYLSRNDEQVKIRGYRVEPGEVEIALRSLEGVTNAAVVAVDNKGQTQLASFFTGVADPVRCRDQLAAQLPNFMVPDRIEKLDSLPLTTNGKIDRAFLATLGAPRTSVARAADSSNERSDQSLQQMLVLWREVLRHDDVDADSDFFQAGGTSISAIRLIARLKRQFGISIDFSVLLENPSPRKLSGLFAPAWLSRAGVEEDVLAQIREVLPDADLNLDTDFFRTGLTSLSGMRLVAKLKRNFGYNLDFAVLVENPTARSLAARLKPKSPVSEHLLNPVLKVLRDVLPGVVIEADTDFFLAGGNSLAAIRAVAKLKRSIAGQIANDLVIKGRTPRRIATMIEGPSDDPERLDAPSLKLSAGDTPVISPAELQLWFEHQISIGGGGYVMQSAWCSSREVDQHDVDCAIAALAKRHPVLRTSYGPGKGTGPGAVNIRVLAETPVRAKVLRCNPQDIPKALIQAVATEDARQPFDLSRGHSFRISAVSHPQHGTCFVLTLHHIVSDGVTRSLLLQDLAKALDGKLPDTQPAGDYRAYAQWRWQKESSSLRKQIAEWQAILADPPAPLDLPLDRTRRKDHVPKGASHVVSIPAVQVSKIEHFAREQGCTLYTVLVAAYAVLLHRLTGSNDVLIGVPVSERPDQFESVAGLFLNTVPLRLRLDGFQSFGELVTQSKQGMTDLMRLREVPFAEIVKAVNPERHAGRTPLFQTVLDWQDLALPLAEASIEVVPLPVTTAPFDIALSASRESDGGINAGFIFDVGLIDEATVKGWARSLVKIVDHVTAHADTPIAEVPALAAEDVGRARLRGPEPNPSLDLNAVLMDSMELNSDQVALSYGAKEITYEELLRLCSEVKTDCSATVFVDTSDPLERVVSGVAAVLSGRAIALIDPALPDFRRDGMRKLLAQVPPEPDLAYVQFTSGSTGVPKAAMLHRAGLANLARTVCRDLSISPGSRVLQLAAPAFDAWIWEVFTTLAGGGTLIIKERAALQPGPPLAATLASNRITHVTLTPSALAAIGAVKLPDLRVVVAAGETLSSELVQMWAPGRRLFNAYGPCEATVCATYGLCQPNETAPHIGTPIAGVSIRIVDRNGELVLPGVTGELCIEGLGVGLGYVADEANTQNKFFVDPNSRERCYRSGDKARIRSDGCIQFIGRDDRQVKVRGVRIELDEVELTLRDTEGVVEAAVKAVSTHEGLPSVAAWVKLESGFAVSDVRNSLANRLPETMLPSHMVHVSDLPLTATGKIDRRRLELPVGDLLLEGDQPEPGSETQLAEVFRDLLQLKRPPGRHQNFFTLGGHSILAVRLADEIKKLFGKQVPLGLIFANPTPAGLAQMVSNGGQKKVLLRVFRDGIAPTAYFIHSVDGTCKAYELLAASWPTDRRIVAVEQGDEFVNFSEQVTAYAEAIEASAANLDPVLIVGWSLGAAIAAEITRLLRRSGRDVRVVLIDAAVPSHIDDNGAIRRDLADIEQVLGIDSITLRRVEQNVIQAGRHVFAHAGGSAVLFRAEMTSRDGLDETLGWASIFSRVSVKSIPGASHQTIIREGNLAHLGSRIENAWMEQTE